MSSGRQITLRYQQACAGCGTLVPAAATAWWFRETKLVRCVPCGPDTEAAPAEANTGSVTSLDVAGASAQREFERRSEKRKADVRRRHPRIGGLLLALQSEPSSTSAWQRGAEGERKLGARLDQLRSDGAVVLHDRRIPGGRANIDHIVVAASGVWVIDAKRYQGQVTRRERGFLRTETQLFVGRRDCSSLVNGLEKQRNAVCVAVEPVGPLPINTVLCFVDAEWGLFAKPFEVDGATVVWPRALVDMIRRPGPLSGSDIEVAGGFLSGGLPPS
jgi:hypothetical protein